jgi:hypothetical protein
MYRIGHGDCFLIAFAGDNSNKPVYVLIDCGYKPGSPEKIERVPQKGVDDVVANLRAATGGTIDVAIITHEHQDHCNGITENRFKGISIKQAWFAWTEDPADDVANALRKRFDDKLVALAAARQRLAADGHPEETNRINELMAFELGGETDDLTAGLQGLAAANGSVPPNKKSMKVFKDLAKANDGVKFLRPHESIYSLPGAKNVRVFALGPPRNETQLLDVDPEGQEEFHMAGGGGNGYFGNIFLAEKESPFEERYCLPAKDAFANPEHGVFFTRRYGKTDSIPDVDPGSSSGVPNNADWRRIDGTWVMSALQLAIDVNNATNNSSLVLAFELGKGGKVLLFAGDAQRGNWISWAEKDWVDGNSTVTTKDLMGRTVLYKVGHHGSHNATLHGAAGDAYPNLGWMGLGEHASEFTAMITAVRAWALTQKGWNHPLKAIKEALLKKCSGRVFQTDADVEKMPLTSDDKPTKASGDLPPNWSLFEKRFKGDPLYFDLEIKP